MSLSRGRKAENGPKVEINIVPLVDVSLVLLIIFMVTATFIRSAGMHIRLPASATAKSAAESRYDVVIGVDAEGSFLWGGMRVSEDQLLAVLRKAARSRPSGSRVIIQGDERAAHGRVVRAMTLAQQVGFGRLVISTRKEVSVHVRPR